MKEFDCASRYRISKPAKETLPEGEDIIAILVSNDTQGENYETFYINLTNFSADS
jgi:hypothetical protein